LQFSTFFRVLRWEEDKAITTLFVFVCCYCLQINACQLHLQELSSDSSQHVRSALASVIMGMAPVLGKVRAMMQQFFELVFSVNNMLFEFMCFTLNEYPFHVFSPNNVKYFIIYTCHFFFCDPPLFCPYRSS
jgi:hypothetical protein